MGKFLPLCLLWPLFTIYYFCSCSLGLLKSRILISILHISQLLWAVVSFANAFSSILHDSVNKGKGKWVSSLLGKKKTPNTTTMSCSVTKDKRNNVQRIISSTLRSCIEWKCRNDPRMWHSRNPGHNSSALTEAGWEARTKERLQVRK